jgi:hypothetical protein
LKGYSWLYFVFDIFRFFMRNQSLWGVAIQIEIKIVLFILNQVRNQSLYQHLIKILYFTIVDIVCFSVIKHLCKLSFHSLNNYIMILIWFTSIMIKDLLIRILKSAITFPPLTSYVKSQLSSNLSAFLYFSSNSIGFYLDASKELK